MILRLFEKNTQGETMDNHFSLTFKAISKNEAFARNAVAAFCVELNPTVDRLNDIKTAVSEAVTNCIVHAYAGQEGNITVEAALDNGALHIAVIDQGVGIEDIQKARQPFYTTKPDDERSGMGFTVMESFMDTLTVSKNSPSGVVVRMSKKLICAE